MTLPLAARVDVIRHHAANPPRNAGELARLAAAIAGSRWIDRAVCAGHATPFELLKAVHFVEAAEVLGVGPRGGWKTKTLGLLNVVDMLTRPGYQIAHASATTGQALRVMEWTRAFLLGEAVLATGLVDPQKLLKWGATMPNGARLQILPTSATGFNAARVNAVRLDEFELVKPELVNELRMVPQSFSGWSRSIVFVSSRKFRNGNVDRLLHDRRSRTLLRLLWCSLDVAERCPEERRGVAEAEHETEDVFHADAPPVRVRAWERCGACGALPFCRGALARASGEGRIADLIEEFSKLDRQSFLSQKLSLRPGESRGNVFLRFARARNVAPLALAPGVPLRLSVDFGEGAAATAVLFWQEVAPRVVHVLGEFVRARSGIAEDVAAVESVLARRFPGARVGRCAADSQHPLLLGEWNRVAQAFKLVPVKKLSTKRAMVSELLSLVEPADGATRYRVDPSCVTHIEEMQRFRRLDPQVRSPRPDVESYSDRRNDTVDAATYIALEVARRPGTQVAVRLSDVAGAEVPAAEPAGPSLADALAAYYPERLRAIFSRALGRRLA